MPVRPRSAGHLRTAPTRRHHAGIFGVGGCPTGATAWPPPASLPTGTAVPTALESHEHVSGHAAARQSVLTRSVIAPHAQRIVEPLQLKFLSRFAALCPARRLPVLHSTHSTFEQRVRVGEPSEFALSFVEIFAGVGPYTQISRRPGIRSNLFAGHGRDEDRQHPQMVHVGCV